MAPALWTTATEVMLAGLLRKAMPNPRREQQRKDEHPEDDFRLAFEFQHASPEQMRVAGPAAVAARGGRGHWRPTFELRSLRNWRGGFGCHSVLAQMTAGQVDENVFETRLARAQVFELLAL